MAKSYYVFSTLAADVAYTSYNPGGGDIQVPGESILIKGGANVTNKQLHTPLGLATKITEDQLKVLESNDVFQLHKKNGYISVSDKIEDPEKVAADMTTRDASAPLVPQDYERVQKEKGARPMDVANEADTDKDEANPHAHKKHK